MTSSYVSLHNHSDFSLLHGFGTVKEYVETAKAKGMTALALTDESTLRGVFHFMKFCEQAGIKPIPGIEFCMAPEPYGVTHKEDVSYHELKRNPILYKGAATHLTVLAKNNQGMQNLYRLVYMSSLPEHFYRVPRIDLHLLEEHKEGLIVLSGDPFSELNIRLALGQFEEAEKYLEKMKSIFKDDFYIELQNREDVQGYSLSLLNELARKHKIETVITNDVLYAKREDHLSCEINMALGSYAKMSETPDYEGGNRPTPGRHAVRYLMDREELEPFFPYERYKESYDNTVKIANEVHVTLDFDTHLRPQVDSDVPAVDLLKKKIKEGFKKKRGKANRKLQRKSFAKIKHELEVLESNDFVDYFLVVEDYCTWAQGHGVPLGAGRGCFLPTSHQDKDGVKNNNTVTTMYGNVPIESPDLINSRVMTKTGEFYPILERFEYDVKDEPCVRLYLNNGKAIDCTKDHLIYTSSYGLTFVEAGDLKEGDALLVHSERGLGYDVIRLVRKKDFIYTGKVYDIEVDGDEHNYTLGGAIVHNSCGGSEIAYVLDISKTDPIRYDLLFERFLSPGRGSLYEIDYTDGTNEEVSVSERHKLANGEEKYTHQLEIGDVLNKENEKKEVKDLVLVRQGGNPDIDTDFHTQGREKVLDYVKEKYGKDHVANIITFGTFRARNSLKGICNVFDIPFSVANRLARMIPDNATLDDMINPLSERYPEGSKFRDESNAYLRATVRGKIYNSERLLELAANTEGRVRDTGVHACGVLISSKPLYDVIPTIMTEDGLYLTEWDYPSCESLGLIKMDFLGLDTVDLIETATRYIKENRGVTVSRNVLIEGKKDDPATYQLFQEGKTTGLFQFGSEGVKRFLRDLQPDSFDDLYAVTALYRPGPMGMNAHNEYARKKRGDLPIIPFDNPKFLNTKVYDVLEPTFGLCIFQETLMTLARECAGFSPYETDLLRKATGKKKKDLLEDLKPKFLEGIKETVNSSKDNKRDKLNQQDLEDMWSQIEGFSSYSFNKSHAVSYALTGYVAAYLKANFPVEFMAAALQQQKDKKDKFKELIQETKNMGIKILPPSVNKSVVDTVPVKDRVYLGFSMLKGITEDTGKEIVKERIENGDYESLQDFVERLIHRDVLNKKIYDSLCYSGAFDELEPSRKYALESFKALSKEAKKKSPKRLENTVGLGLLIQSKPKSEAEKHEDFSFLERCQHEYDLLGVYLTSHPLDGIDYVDGYSVKETFDQIVSKRTYDKNFVAVVSEKENKRTKRGGNAALLTLDTGKEIFKQIIFESDFLDPSDIETGAIYKITATARNWSGNKQLFVNEMQRLV